MEGESCLSSINRSSLNLGNHESLAGNGNPLSPQLVCCLAAGEGCGNLLRLVWLDLL